MMQNESRLWARIEPDKQPAISEATAVIPVQVGSLAASLGLEVKIVALEPNISGEIRPSDTSQSGYKIRINRHEQKTRQRFTIAHEMAHYLLHRDRIGTGISDNVLYRSGLSNEIEWEANRLAAELLMPRVAVKEELEKIGGIATLETARDLADVFQVSLPAMKIRLGLE
jgi:Zn-dependent peptidase ImmA (M78 family)